MTEDVHLDAVTLRQELDHGADVIGQITDLAKEKEIETGFFSVIGALSRAELGYYDQVTQKYGIFQIFDPMELVHCSGNISLRNDQPFVHAHAVLSDSDGKVWAGHLNSGTVFAAELYIQELLGLPLQRVPDSITGLFVFAILSIRIQSLRSELAIFRIGISSCSHRSTEASSNAVAIGIQPACRMALAKTAKGSLTCFVPTIIPGGKPVTDEPGLIPRSPVTVVAPVLVIAEPARTTKPTVDDRTTGS